MKKRYFKPEMELVDMEMEQVMLTGSLDLYDETVTDSSEILSPEMNEIILFD